MRRNLIRTIALVAPFLLTVGCATSDDNYPSLAIRDVERIDETVNAPQSLAAAPLPAETAARVDALATDARDAHSRFMTAVPRARAIVRRGRGASVASDNWASAQVAIADLETLRSITAVPLADLDQIYTNATVDFEQRAMIERARAEITRLIVEQDRILTELGSVAGL
ncbi:MAG: hypothetical protein WA908_08480 [Pontixanthobacter sp.]